MLGWERELVAFMQANPTACIHVDDGVLPSGIALRLTACATGRALKLTLFDGLIASMRESLNSEGAVYDPVLGEFVRVDWGLIDGGTVWHCYGAVVGTARSGGRRVLRAVRGSKVIAEVPLRSGVRWGCADRHGRVAYIDESGRVFAEGLGELSALSNATRLALSPNGRVLGVMRRGEVVLYDLSGEEIVLTEKGEGVLGLGIGKRNLIVVKRSEVRLTPF